MKAHLSFLALTLSLLALSPAPAEAASGKLLAVVRCLCSASMVVELNGVQGYVKNDTRVDSVVLNAKGKLVRIEKPEAGLRAYYVIFNLAEYPQVVDALKANGIDPATLDRVTLESFEAPASTPIYRDHNGQDRIN